MVVEPFMFFSAEEMGAGPPQEFSLILGRARGGDRGRGWRGQAGVSVTRGWVARPSRSIDYLHSSF